MQKYITHRENLGPHFDCFPPNESGRVLYLAADVDAAMADLESKAVAQALRIRELEKYERDYKRLATAINLQPGECLPECDSYGHAEKCTYANDAENFMRMTERLVALETALREIFENSDAVNCLDRDQFEKLKALVER